MKPARGRAAALTLCAVGLAAAAPVASAAGGDYRSRSFDQPASRGLEVRPPLEEFRAVARARVTVPGDWRRLEAPAGRLRFLTPGAGCKYRVTFTVTSRVGDRREPADEVAARLAPPGSAFLLDEGRRLGSAWRTVRQRSSGGVVRMDALRVAVLTRRADIAPNGRVVWADLDVTAASRTGDECHSGSYRERVGPQISDALATARTSLRFVRR
jgi:hypothetical protein